MKLITKEIQKKLDANLKISEDKRKPYLKLFNPCGQATWLISEYNKETGIMFGLCDLGQGIVEFGYVSLDELKDIKLPLMNDSVVFLLTTHKFLPDAFDILKIDKEHTYFYMMSS